MECPECYSSQITKNGHRRGRQCNKCKESGRQFLEIDRPCNKVCLWTAVDHQRVGILAWVIADPSAETFAPLC
ncbi:IS1/IS1595 family N-terminal zinc-binding domain-containing protein [Nostoc sp.]|uniref:IS1/IS1595 family N-terminal zinc-binding domain-containing protein n=1 Tax=Nostoc sp. TaxID=1180 RepID=UPI003FA5B267